MVWKLENSGGIINSISLKQGKKTPNVKVIVIFKVADRKDVFPPESWFKDEDCQLLIDSWNWQGCRNNSLTEKVKRMQEQSGTI